MSRKQTIAVLMGLAPAAPGSFAHAPQPVPPSPKDYFEPLEARAARFRYVEDGADTSLIEQAYGLADWFVDDRRTNQPDTGDWLDAGDWLDDSTAGILQLHPETNRADLTTVKRQITLAMQQFVRAYERYELSADAWKVKRDLLWRRQWAERIYAAAPDDEPNEVAA